MREQTSSYQHCRWCFDSVRGRTSRL